MYYAPDKPVTAVEVARVADVLNGKVYCNPDWYFMFSLADVRALDLEEVEPMAKFEIGPDRAIWVYEYWYARRSHRG